MARRTKRASGGLRLEGMDDLKRKLLALPLHERIAARTALKATAMAVEATAKDLAPYDEGELQESIAHYLRDGGTVAVVGTDLWRAHFPEFGTEHAAAKPFLFPAFERHRAPHVRAMADAMDDAHKEVAR